MLNALVSIIDKSLRKRDGIFEFSNSPDCIFRVQLVAITGGIALADGTKLAAGSRIILLHLWNEHVPPFPSRGPTLAWARQICHGLEISLRELATFVAERTASEDIAAVAGKMMFGSIQQTDLVAHLAARYGFVRAVDPAPGPSVAQRLHLLGENILISMIVLSHNPAALRTDCFRRNPVPVYLRRSELLERFGVHKAIAPAHQTDGDRPIPSFGPVVGNCK